MRVTATLTSREFAVGRRGSCQLPPVKQFEVELQKHRVSIHRLHIADMKASYIYIWYTLGFGFWEVC